MENTGIYQNGISARQIECHLVLEDGCVLIYLQDETKELLIWDLKALDSCHLNGSHLIIKYGAYPHQTLECRDEIASIIYKAWSGTNVVRQVEGYTFKSKRSSMILLIFIFLGLGIFTFLYLIPLAGEKAANLIPVEAEIQLGESIGKIYMDQRDSNDSANYYMREFVKQLNFDDTYKIDVRVIESEEINAFALPGGKIFVYSGIIDKMESYEELVALLGHEVTHVINRHSLKSICRSAATGIFIATLFGDITGISSGILSQADKFKQLDYSRDLETEADNDGLEIMMENKIDPKGMVDLLELLKIEGESMSPYMKYLSTHPDTDARISNISANPNAKTDFPDNKKLEEIFKKLKRCI